MCNSYVLYTSTTYEWNANCEFLLMSSMTCAGESPHLVSELPIYNWYNDMASMGSWWHSSNRHSMRSMQSACMSQIFSTGEWQFAQNGDITVSLWICGWNSFMEGPRLTEKFWSEHIELRWRRWSYQVMLKSFLGGWRKTSFSAEHLFPVAAVEVTCAEQQWYWHVLLAELGRGTSPNCQRWRK